MNRVNQEPRIDIQTLAALASGSASPAVALLIESTLDMRGMSQTVADILAGATLEGETPAQMRPDALERALSAIGAQPSVHDAKTPADAAHELIRIPARLRQAIDDAERRNAWKSAGGGISSLQLGLPGDAKAEILRISPGAATPRHTHGGQELTLCLTGGFSDGIGSYGPGDVSITDPSITHRPVADDDGPCYVLAVTDAGLKFTGWLGLLQKVFAR